MRDKDAVQKLKELKGFEKIEDLYSFRNKLFKFDFNYDEQFKKDLKSNVMLLEALVNIVNNERKARDAFFVNNKEW